MPFNSDELDVIVAELRKLPPESLESIGGITIVDDTKKSSFGILGVHDTFGNIVLIRNYNEELLRGGIRIEGVGFFKELVTHETWHANEKDLSRDEFELFSRCGGYMRTGLYSPDYEIVESRTMTSTYHTNIHEEFAEHGTHYELNPTVLRQRALHALESDGDPYLALQYLFFMHIPEESRGREYIDGRTVPAGSDEIPEAERISIPRLREIVENLPEEFLPAEKKEYVRRLLVELEKASYIL